jgi:4-hydroxy-tetrahydrodipicolinate synthase
MHIQGLFTAIVTPFHADGSLNIAGLRENIRFQLNEGVDGIVALGTTGECPTLSEEEQVLIVKIAREEVGDKACLMVGTGFYSTSTTIKATQRAKDLGADAALIVSPYYNKPTQEGIFRHFEAVTQAVDLPVMVYNHQGRTGQNVQTETLARLARLPRIIGVKESTGNVIQLMDIVAKTREANPDFKIMSGIDELTLTLMVHGGNGAISVISNLLPGKMRELVVAAARNDYAEAREIHYEMLPYFHGACIETNPIPVKAMMDIAGMPAGPCRLPLCELMPDNHRRLCDLMARRPVCRVRNV